MQTTLHSAGTAVLPHKKPLMKVITALFDAPSKVGSSNSVPWCSIKSESPSCRLSNVHCAPYGVLQALLLLLKACQCSVSGLQALCFCMDLVDSMVSG